MNSIVRIAIAGLLSALVGCSTVKYNALEKVGIHKRDLLVGNVEDTRDAQKEAQEQFQDALERFGSVVNIEETGLKKAYKRLKSEYDDSVDAAEEVSEQIAEVEEVADDLFKEWSEENKQYTDANLRRDSEQQLKATRTRYGDMLSSMKQAEQSMQPVLNTLRDNVLYLKHNLNAQAVGSLRTTFDDLEVDIERLIKQMNQSIERSNAFIANMKPA
ncbi:MAG: DUF2959 domain-containing protein [Granulosicoccus sp.]